MPNHNFNLRRNKWKHKDYDHFYNKDSKDDNHERSAVPFFIGLVTLIAVLVIVLVI